MAAAVAATVACAAAAGAQGIIAGTVVDSASRAPIPGVQVTVENTTLGNLTDANGHFSIRGASGTQATVVARRIGYGSARQVVTVGDTTVTLALVSRPMSLDVVVVTGTPNGQTKREIGNAVTSIDVASITKIAPVTSFQELVNGRAPNVVIMPGTGEVGSGAKIRVRGTSSLSLNQTPLIYVDGVRMDNSQATGPANQAFGSGSISRWNDIDPEDIERIEILKGPSAATLYGTEAANGVIQIITKQGAAGKTRYDFSMTQGANFFMNPEGRIPTNYGVVDGNIQSITFKQLNDSYKSTYGRDIFRTGHHQKYHAGVSGGTDRFQYYVAGVREEDEGVDLTNDLGRTSARANLTVQPSEKFKMQAHLNYLNGRTNLAPEAGYGGRMWTVMLMDPAGVGTPTLGFGSSFPWQYDETYHMYQDIGRFTGSVQITHQPTSWFSQRLIFGADQVNTNDVEMAARIDSLRSTNIGTDALGYKFQSNNTNKFRTFDYAATARFDALPGLNLATSVGGQYYIKRFEYVSAGGFVFAAPGLTSIGSLTRDFSSGQDVAENRTLGYYVQEQIGWKDRRYLTLALRSDKNSAFGEGFGRAYYPKASVSWVVSDEPFFGNISWLNSLRLRAAYGESGQQPNDFDAIRTYAGVTGPNDEPAVTPQSFGNADLGPERSREFETGFETSLFDDRAGLEFTFYNKNTKDAILDRAMPPSIGFANTQFVNAGEVSNKGVELLARVTPVRNNTVTWDASVAFSYNKNKIVDLGLPGVKFLSAGTYERNQAGYPVGAWFEKKVVSAQLDDAGNAINVMCDDGLGGQVDCASAPQVYLGSSIPDKQGAFTSTVTLWNKLKLYGLVDFQLGQKKLDGNYRIRCYFVLGGTCREMLVPQDYSPVLEAGIQNSMPFYLISDASFFKLRELSATYSLPDRFAAALHASAASITVAGRNLHTWTKYKGMEPEAQFLGGSRGGSSVSWEQTDTPQLSSFVATLNVSF
ncbi:MAG TPA: SusC/RagA family TonB-linked outer membrane protein [Gemmatimonadaceae bacterium]